MNIGQIELKWLGHSGFLIKNHRIIYIDPYNIKEGLPKADMIFITHGHYDHCSVEDIKKVIKDGTKIFVTADAQSKVVRFDIPIEIIIVEPNQDIDLGDVKVSTVFSYNVDKHFHQREEGWVGYVIKMNDCIICHLGDTDVIPEMQKLTGYKQLDKNFVVLFPVGGRFTMSAEEAFEAAKIIKPSLAIPMHWGTVIGSEDDAKEFVDLCKEAGIDAQILPKE
ncbi:MAG: MBL fold metallo-hydrolase [Parcubacteria group bacterium]|jgi:L-ascorbate metabolism protein UlaG (beta-lactamase superfamily)